MENKPNFIEIAEYCVKQMKEKHNCYDNEYKATLFCAIFDNQEYQISYTPQILRNATYCILVHKWLELAYTNRYPHTLIEIIDEEGAVHHNGFAGGYTISCTDQGTRLKTIRLLKDNLEIYKSFKHEEIAIPRILEVVKQTQGAANAKEAQLIAQLMDKDIEIEQLKKDQVIQVYKEMVLSEEVKIYKSMLKQFKEDYEKLIETSSNPCRDSTVN